MAELSRAPAGTGGVLFWDVARSLPREILCELALGFSPALKRRVKWAAFSGALKRSSPA